MSTWERRWRVPVMFASGVLWFVCTIASLVTSREPGISIGSLAMWQVSWMWCYIWSKEDERTPVVCPKCNGEGKIKREGQE